MLAQKALQSYGNPAGKTSKKAPQKLENTSFYELFDMEATLRHGYPDLKEAYHHSLQVRAFKMRWAYRKEPAALQELRLDHVRGEISGKTDGVIRTVITLVFKQMERLRLEDPERYLRYLKSGRFYVETNRGQIRTMNKDFGKANSLKTITTALNLARAAGIVSDTWHTSRTVHEVVSEKGRKTKIVTMTERGRGNFWLFISPELFVPKATLNLPSEHLGGFKKQNLHESNDTSTNLLVDEAFDTKKREKNNCGTVENKALPIGKPDKDKPQPIGFGDESGNERGMSHLSRISKQIGEKTPKVRHLTEPDATAELEKWKAAGGRRAEKRREQLRTDEKVRRALPEKELDRMAAYCWLLCKELIWPNFDEKYMQSITLHAIALLKLHLYRLDLPLEDAHNVVSYAIQRQAEQLSKGGYCYAPMQFLNPDLDYTGGTLRHVIDQWLINGEFKRLDERNMRYEKQVKWNYAYGHSHKVFKLFVKDLESHGYSFVTQRLLSGHYDRLLQKYFTKNGIGKKAQATIRKKFSDRASAQVMGLKKLTEGSKRDGFMVAFEGWRKGKSRAANQ